MYSNASLHRPLIRHDLFKVRDQGAVVNIQLFCFEATCRITAILVWVLLLKSVLNTEISGVDCWTIVLCRVSRFIFLTSSCDFEPSKRRQRFRSIDNLLLLPPYITNRVISLDCNLSSSGCDLLLLQYSSEVMNFVQRNNTLSSTVKPSCDSSFEDATFLHLSTCVNF